MDSTCCSECALFPARQRAAMICRMIVKPWQFILCALAGWMNYEQQKVIEYLKEENKILREKLGHKRILLDGGSSHRKPRRPPHRWTQ